jgi:hypothetical protein
MSFDVRTQFGTDKPDNNDADTLQSTTSEAQGNWEAALESKDRAIRQLEDALTSKENALAAIARREREWRASHDSKTAAESAEHEHGLRALRAQVAEANATMAGLKAQLERGGGGGGSAEVTAGDYAIPAQPPRRGTLRPEGRQLDPVLRGLLLPDNLSMPALTLSQLPPQQVLQRFTEVATQSSQQAAQAAAHASMHQASLPLPAHAALSGQGSQDWQPPRDSTDAYMAGVHAVALNTQLPQGADQLDRHSSMYGGAPAALPTAASVQAPSARQQAPLHQQWSGAQTQVAPQSIAPAASLPQGEHQHSVERQASEQAALQQVHSAMPQPSLPSAPTVLTQVSQQWQPPRDSTGTGDAAGAQAGTLKLQPPPAHQQDQSGAYAAGSAEPVPRGNPEVPAPGQQRLPQHHSLPVPRPAMQSGVPHAGSQQPLAHLQSAPVPDRHAQLAHSVSYDPARDPRVARHAHASNGQPASQQGQQAQPAPASAPAAPAVSRQPPVQPQQQHQQQAQQQHLQQQLSQKHLYQQQQPQGQQQRADERPGQQAAAPQHIEATAQHVFGLPDMASQPASPTNAYPPSSPTFAPQSAWQQQCPQEHVLTTHRAGQPAPAWPQPAQQPAVPLQPQQPLLYINCNSPVRPEASDYASSHDIVATLDRTRKLLADFTSRSTGGQRRIERRLEAIVEEQGRLAQRLHESEAGGSPRAAGGQHAQSQQQAPAQQQHGRDRLERQNADPNRGAASAPTPEQLEVTIPKSLLHQALEATTAKAEFLAERVRTSLRATSCCHMLAHMYKGNGTRL